MKIELVSKNETVIKIENKYFIDSSNITYDRNLKQIFQMTKPLFGTIIKIIFHQIILKFQS